MCADVQAATSSQSIDFSSFIFVLYVYVLNFLVAGLLALGLLLGLSVAGFYMCATIIFTDPVC